MEAMEDDDEDDEMKAQRVAEERRKRREEIMRKHASVKENARENENADASVNEKPPPPVQTTKPVPAKPEPENKKNPAMPISDMFADTENFDDEAEERHAQRANRLSGKFAEVRIVFPKSRTTVYQNKTETFFYLSPERKRKRRGGHDRRAGG